MSFNKIVVVGNIGRDAEVKFTPQGQQVCEFSVATNEKRTNGEIETTWFQISAWGKLAETCSQYLSKGREVYIEGRLRVREWSDREGRTRFSLEVNATEVRFLGNRASETNSQQEEIPAQQAIQAPQTVEVAPVAVAKEANVPPTSNPKPYTKTYKNSGNGKASKVTVKDPFI
jgi:single-strand DNA-binding protein